MELNLTKDKLIELKKALAIHVIAGNKAEDKIIFKLTEKKLGLFNQQNNVFCSYQIKGLSNKGFKEGEEKYFSFINIDEFLYAINNNTSETLDLKILPNSIKVEVNSLNLQFSLISYDTEFDDLSMTEDKTIKKFKDNLSKVSLDLNGAGFKKHLEALGPLLNTSYSNSGVYFAKDKLIYNDPTIVYTTKDVSLPTLAKDEVAYLNSDVLKLLTAISSKTIAQDDSPILVDFSDNFNYVGLTAGSMFVQFLNSKLTIENPEEVDITGINPCKADENPSTLEFNKEIMLKSLKFLSGFCSGSDWKVMNFAAEKADELVINIKKDAVFDAKETLKASNILEEKSVSFNLLLDCFNVILSSFETKKDDVCLYWQDGVVGIKLDDGTVGNTEIIFAGVQQ